MSQAALHHCRILNCIRKWTTGMSNMPEEFLLRLIYFLYSFFYLKREVGKKQKGVENEFSLTFWDNRMPILLKIFIYIKWFKCGMNTTHFQISLLLHLSSSLICIRWQNNLSVFWKHKPIEKTIKYYLHAHVKTGFIGSHILLIKYIQCVM